LHLIGDFIDDETFIASGSGTQQHISKFSVNRDRPPYPSMSPEVTIVGGSSKRRDGLLNYTPEEQVWNPDELEPTTLFEGRKRKRRYYAKSFFFSLSHSPGC